MAAGGGRRLGGSGIGDEIDNGAGNKGGDLDDSGTESRTGRLIRSRMHGTIARDIANPDYGKLLAFRR